MTNFFGTLGGYQALLEGFCGDSFTNSLNNPELGTNLTKA